MNDKIEVNQIRMWTASNRYFIITEYEEDKTGAVNYKIRYLQNGQISYPFAHNTIFHSSVVINNEQG